MAIRNHTGILPWRLNGSGGGQQQRFVPGQALSWLMKSLPAVTDGKLCNYMLGLMVTVAGSLVLGQGPDGPIPPPPGSAAGRLQIRTMWDTLRTLISSVEVRSAWHGTALSSQHVKGSFLQLIELVGNGLERPYRIRPAMRFDPQAPSARRYFRYSFFVPLCLLAGQKGHHTALPACMYENAEFTINTGTGTNVMGDAIHQTAGAYDCTFDVSALLLPQDEVWVGPSVQWIDYQQRVSGEAVDINGLGSVSTVDRVEKGAGIAGLFWLSNRLDLPGPQQVRDITDITFPFRGVVHTTHIDPLIRQLETIIGCKQDTAGAFIGGAGDGSMEAAGDVGGFPYDDFDYGTTELGESDPLAASTPPNPSVLALVCPTKDLEVTKVQQSEGTQQLQMQFRVPVDPALCCGSTHHILALQLHSWTPEAWTSAKQLLIEKGVCRKVLGTDDVDWSIKVLNKQNPDGIMDRKRRFMAMRLVPMAHPAVKVG
jgi:hypothetical protein